MRTARRALVVLTALALTAGAAPLLASQEPQPPQKPQQVQGELLRVDTESKTLAIKTSADEELQFRYTDATAVTGEEKSIAGPGHDVWRAGDCYLRGR